MGSQRDPHCAQAVRAMSDRMAYPLQLVRTKEQNNENQNQRTRRRLLICAQGRQGFLSIHASVLTNVKAGSQSTGAGAGKASFNPFSITKKLTRLRQFFNDQEAIPGGPSM